MPSIIDSHCHPEKWIRQGILDEMLNQSLSAGVGGCIAVGTDPGDWDLYADAARRHPGRLAYSIGLHPCHVSEDWEADLAKLLDRFPGDHPPCAVGEMGLDFFHLPKDPLEKERQITRQRRAFEQQLGWASNHDLPIIIHSRNAFEETLAMIDASGVDGSKVVFHCFSEGPEQVEKINRRGIRASFTGILTYPSAKAIRAALLAQGADRLMVETDSPYLPPQSKRGNPNHPAYVREVLETAAGVLALRLESLKEQVWRNTRSFFRLPEGFGEGDPVKAEDP